MIKVYRRTLGTIDGDDHYMPVHGALVKNEWNTCWPKMVAPI